VVSRLVEQQHVGRRQQQPAERHAALLATRELVDDRIPGRQAQLRPRRFSSFSLQFPAADGVDGVLQLRLLLEQLVHLRPGRARGRRTLSLISLKARDLRERAAESFHHDGSARPC
jgi:hypothetical protein